MGKNTPQRRIDAPRDGDGSRDAEIQLTQGNAILGAPLMDVPTDVTWVTTYIDISDYTPLAAVELSWRFDNATPPDVFLIQWSTSSSFTNPTTVSVAGTQWTATLRGLPTDTLLYIRIAARRAGVVSPWSASITGTTASDTTPLAAVSSPAATWNITTGDVTITWTPPTDRRYKHTNVTIRNASTNAILRTVTAVAGRYVWTFAQQVQDTGGSFVYSIRIDFQPITTRNIAGTTTQVTVSAPSLSAPTGVTTSWAGDTGTAEADCLITWNHVSGAAYYDISINSLSRSVGYVNRYLYTYEQNRRENGGNGAPTLTIAVTARDVYNRTATTTLTATNAAPPTPSAPTITALFSACRFTWPAITARDARRLALTVQRDGSDVLTVTLSPQTTEYLFEASQSGTYRARLVVVDMFEQTSAASAWSSTASLTDTAQFVQELRAGVTYRDSVGTASSTLNALKDANTSAGGVSYSASSSWRWIEASYDREIRHRTTTLSTASTTIAAYIGVSNDGSTYTWYTGGTVSGGVWTPTQQTSESAAQTNATSLAAGVYRIQLPSPVQTRYIRLGFRNTSAAVRIDEFYPRSLVQGDDIEAETIRGIHIAASSITADRLSVGSLSAISADLGTVTAGSITGVTITGGIITGSTIQTTTSGARVVLNNTGLYTYDSTNQIVARVNTATDGAIQVGDVLYVDRDWIKFVLPTTGAPTAAISWLSPNNASATISAFSTSSTEMNLNVRAVRSNFSDIASLDCAVFGSETRSRLETKYSSYQSQVELRSAGSSSYVQLVTSSSAGIHSLVELQSLGYVRVQAAEIYFNNNAPPNNPFLTFRPPSSTIQLHTNPVISSFANKYTALNFGGPAGQARDFVFGSTSTDPSTPNFSTRFFFRLTADAETGNAAGSNFSLSSCNDDASGRHTILYVTRSSGHVGFGGIPSVSNGGVGSIDVYGDARIRGTLRAKTDWTTITLENNWQDCGSLTGDPSVAYRIMPDGTVQFRGAIRRTSGTSQRIFTMPTALQGDVVRRVVVSYRSNGSSVFAASQLTYLPSNSHGVFFDGPSITNSSGTTVEGVVMLWMTWNLFG
jgi:hypothetical protein